MDMIVMHQQSDLSPAHQGRYWPLPQALCRGLGEVSLGVQPGMGKVKRGLVGMVSMCAPRHEDRISLDRRFKCLLEGKLRCEKERFEPLDADTRTHSCPGGIVGVRTSHFPLCESSIWMATG
jgi:hypothetical protein